MKTPVVAATMALLVASLATLAWLAKTRGEIVPPAAAPEFGAMLDRAAQAAQGRRVLAILSKRGAPAVARIFDSGRVPEGWRAFAPTAEAADPLLPALQRLADAAAADFAPDHRLENETLRALAVFDVAVVAATDGENAILPQIGERDASVGAAPEVPGLRVRHAEPIFQFLAEEPTAAADDPVGFSRRLVLSDAVGASEQDMERAPWDVAVTVESPAAAEYLFPSSVAGARVTVDGEPARFRAARVPMLVVELPAGRHRVEVRYGRERAGREWLAIAAAAGAVASLVALWLGLRPHLERPDA
jgi:hypothetical protein